MPSDTYEPKSSIRLEHQHAKKIAKHAIGKKYKFKVTATKTGHHISPMSQLHNADYNIDNIEALENNPGGKDEGMED